MRRAEDWLFDQLGDRPDDFAPGEREVALAFIRRIQADAVHELVALKNLKDTGFPMEGPDSVEGYNRRKPLAWAAARALVAQVPPA